MPIRINLKELFAADAQGVTVDKINFNFNKLLELGIGEQGLRGFSGVQGAAGPAGNQGPSGIRGATWFVDSAVVPDPTIPGLLTGDFYLDSTNFAVWQWDGTSWNFLFNLANIINNYLASSPSPFTRGFGVTTNHPAQDERFIMFNKRDYDGDYFLGYSGAASTNDILFLNNFDETAIAANLFTNAPEFPPVNGSNINTGIWYNSLFAVYVDHREGNVTGRYHLEMGALYGDQLNTSPPIVDPQLTNTLENFKMRFVRENSDLGAYHYNRTLFSLDYPETISPVSKTANAVFQFDAPRVKNPPALTESAKLYIGSQYGLDEITAQGTEENLADGILFYGDDGLELGANIGLTKKYLIDNYPSDTGYVVNNALNNYFMLHNSLNLDALYLNDKVLQNNGNIIQLGTTEPREVHVETAAATASRGQYGAMGICAAGDTIYTVSSSYMRDSAAPDILLNESGFINKFTIENANKPISVFSEAYDGRYGSPGSTPVTCDTEIGSVLPDEEPHISGVFIADIDIVGERAYIVNNQAYGIMDTENHFPWVYEPSTFQIVELNGLSENEPLYVGSLGKVNSSGSSTSPLPYEVSCAWRVKVKGRYAIVARNGAHYASPAQIGGSTFGYTGGLVAIDVNYSPGISFTLVPRILSSIDVPTALDNSAVLDMKINGDLVYTIVWEQDIDPLGNPVDYAINLHVFNLKDLGNYSPPAEITWEGVGDTPIESGTTPTTGGTAYTGYTTIPKFGAVEVTENHIFTGHRGTITVWDRVPTSVAGSVSPISPEDACHYEYSQVTSFNLTFPEIDETTDQVIYDMHHLGNSLYVLASAPTSNSANSYPATKYYIFKFDVSGLAVKSGDIPTAPTQIWTKLLPGDSTRFTIVGKHIYAQVITEIGDVVDEPSLVAIDFDGFYTSGAHIESLRADQIHTTGEVNVGSRLVVQEGAEIGGGALITGELEVIGNSQLSNADINNLIVNDTTKLYTQVQMVNPYIQAVDFDNIKYANNITSGSALGLGVPIANSGTTNTTWYQPTIPAGPANYGAPLPVNVTFNTSTTLSHPLEAVNTYSRIRLTNTSSAPAYWEIDDDLSPSGPFQLGISGRIANSTTDRMIHIVLGGSLDADLGVYFEGGLLVGGTVAAANKIQLVRSTYSSLFKSISFIVPAGRYGYFELQAASSAFGPWQDATGTGIYWNYYGRLPALAIFDMTMFSLPFGL